MLAWIVGNVDFNAAAVLIAFFLMMTITGTTFLGRNRSRLEINNELELAKIKQSDQHEENAFKLETERAFKIKQIEAGLITSHARRDED